MKYLLFLLGTTYIISAIFFAKFFYFDEKKKNILEETKNKIIIIVPEKTLESIKNNPGGMLNENTNSGVGAGFFISSDGKIQTVNHIIENDNLEYKAIYKDKKYDLEVLNRDKQNDLAILKIINLEEEISYFDISQTSNTLTEDNIIYSFGVDIDNLKIIYNSGEIINKKSKLENKTNLLEISNKLSPGFSGGPIINKEGKVIGINYAISEGKNYGINLVK